MFRIFVAVAAAGTIAGCGSICSRATTVNSDLKEKAKACQSITIPSEPESECENELKKCTSDDETKFEASLDCLEKVGSCAAGQELAWVGELAKCAPTGISAECEQATKD